ncbi:hypothetical protein [Chondrinema litorale]|uniref:hypothetical protein n=1 Tax=Chondrinema litorale TaxID=2994555 RepID=UPI002542ACB2|nr:hypothetical protein [Chondrinema litorale]UZR99568.1 hypothetical protein OQ292_37535 [Chondrinema litorale]
MKNIYESSFMKIEFDEKIKLLQATWLENTKNISESQYKSEFLTYLLLANKCPYEKVLINEKQFKFRMGLHIQQWASSMVNTRLIISAKNAKMAVVYSSLAIQKVTAKKMVNEMELQDIKTLYFESKEDAQSWLLEGSIIPSNRKVLLFMNNEFTDFTDQLEKKVASV